MSKPKIPDPAYLSLKEIARRWSLADPRDALLYADAGMAFSFHAPILYGQLKMFRIDDSGKAVGYPEILADYRAQDQDGGRTGIPGPFSLYCNDVGIIYSHGAVEVSQLYFSLDTEAYHLEKHGLSTKDTDIFYVLPSPIKVDRSALFVELEEFNRFEVTQSFRDGAVKQPPEVTDDGRFIPARSQFYLQAISLLLHEAPESYRRGGKLNREGFAKAVVKHWQERLPNGVSLSPETLPDIVRDYIAPLVDKDPSSRKSRAKPKPRSKPKPSS